MEMRQLQLPHVRVQESVFEVLNDIESGKNETEEFWAELDGCEARFQASQKPCFESNIQGVNAIYTPAAKQLNLYKSDETSCIVRFGDVRAKIPRKWGRVTDGDICASQVILATDAGKVNLLDLGNSSKPEKELSGHVLHASVARFFPSEKVAISAGMDYAMKLWDLQSGTQIQTLNSQKGMIDDIVFLGRGRNLLSLSQASSDIVLWEVGKAEVVNRYSIQQLKCIGLWTDERGGSASDESDSLYEAHDKVVFAGTETSTLVLDLRSPEKTNILLSTPSEQIKIIGNLLARSFGGHVAIADLRFPNSDVLTLESTQGPISQLQVTPSKTYIKTPSGTYAYEFSSKTLETVCTEPHGVLTTYNNEVYHLGGTVRHFPL